MSTATHEDPPASMGGRPPIRLTASSLNSFPDGTRPYRYSRSPLKLFLEDAATFGNVLWSITDLARPSTKSDDGDIDLKRSWRAKRDDILIVGTSVIQALSLPILLIGILALPGLLVIVLGALVYLLTGLALMPTQGPRLVESRVNRGNEEHHQGPSHDHEKWIFINGVMVGNIGLQSCVDAIARVFKRPILGIHNETQGFFGDVLECLMQRCFSYSTKDVRAAYEEIYSHITDQNIHKVVLIAHSQGAIIASLVVDRLFTELPQETVGKLEVYTFGSAASHFNNPSHGSSRPTDSHLPNLHMPSGLPVNNLGEEPLSHSLHPPSASAGQSGGSDPGFKACPDHVILTLEHYANEKDPIPRWGVLHSFRALRDTRYSGSLFVRMGASGHFFTSHYLAAWFPLDSEAADSIRDHSMVLNGIDRTDTQDNSQQPIQFGQWNDEMLRAGTSMEWGDKKHANTKDLEIIEKARNNLGEGQLYVLGISPRYSQRMHQISRLWQYVDGRSPD